MSGPDIEYRQNLRPDIPVKQPVAHSMPINDCVGFEVVNGSFAKIKDSGNRRTFETGAVRDMQEGKGRMDLLPALALIRLSKHFEAGAKKYGPRNWQLGIPIASFIDSALRHVFKYMAGMDDEDHLVAAAWNLMCALEMEEKNGYKFDENL